MRILMTNDDGIHAPGLLALARILEREHTVTIAAPDRERSAASHSLTLDRPLTAASISKRELAQAAVYAVNGTPADCVQIGISVLADGPVDLVISGINHGANVGADVSYSGTVHAALEAAMQGVPAVALSQRISSPSPNSEEKYSLSAHLSARVIDMLPLRRLKGSILNINFPVDLRGEEHPFRVCPQGIRIYDTSFRRFEDSFGREFFWATASECCSPYNEEHRTDVFWLSQGCITVTPMSWNVTERRDMELWAQEFRNLPRWE